MKRALTPMLAALLALPLVADEPKKDEKNAATQQTAAAPQQPVVTPGPPAAEDSPLVQAAKRSNRLGKKPANVITNETLKKSGANAHVTTTKEQTSMYIPPPEKKPPPTPEMIAAERAEIRRKQQAAAAAAEQKKKEARDERMARAAEADEELYPEENTDPAETEKALQDAGGEPARSEQKPPVG